MLKQSSTPRISSTGKIAERMSIENCAGDEEIPAEGRIGRLSERSRLMSEWRNKMSTLFQPVTINGLTLKNRLMQSATVEGMATERGEVTDALINRCRAVTRDGHPRGHVDAWPADTCGRCP